MSKQFNWSGWFAQEGTRIRRRVRILMLLDAADYALITPLQITRFHALAYLADVLSPLYDFAPLSGRIMKRRAGPYYPDLQWEVDRLIGLGLVTAESLTPVIEESGAHNDALLSLEREQSRPILERVYTTREFRIQQHFFRELAGALSNIDDGDLDATTRSDVTWMAAPKGNVIDYAEWRARNYSALSAEKTKEIAAEILGTGAVKLLPSAQLSLYIRYMESAGDG